MQQLIFPDNVNGKTPDQMTPDEFEEYLGLAGTEGPLGAMDNAMYGTEP